MTRLSNNKEMQILEDLEIKQEILTLEEIEESVKKLKLDKDNQELEYQFQCAICMLFSHQPINCSDCDFKACQKCFTDQKNSNLSSNCVQCGSQQIKKNAAFLKVRDNLRIQCGNKKCFDPNQKILFKNYNDHLVVCLKKQKCPNECGAEFNSIEKANLHLAQCKKCKICLQMIQMDKIILHDCKMNIQFLNNQKHNLSIFIENQIQIQSQFLKIEEILQSEPDSNLLTPEQIQTYKKLGKMSILQFFRSSNPIDFNNEKFEIKKINFKGGRFSFGQVDKQSKKLNGINRKYTRYPDDKTKNIFVEACYVNNKAEGYARSIFPDGSYYEGQIKQSKACGYGTKVFSNSSIYSGQWKDNKLDGKGKFLWIDGEAYDGEIKQNKKEGQGSYTYKDGKYFIGQWMNDKKHGNGKFFDQKGNLLKELQSIEGQLKY